MNDLRELNDAELGEVSGGMDCKTAVMVAAIHTLTATALHGLGKAKDGDYFNGKAAGVQDGACVQY